MAKKSGLLGIAAFKSSYANPREATPNRYICTLRIINPCGLLFLAAYPVFSSRNETLYIVFVLPYYENSHHNAHADIIPASREKRHEYRQHGRRYHRGERDLSLQIRHDNENDRAQSCSERGACDTDA